MPGTNTSLLQKSINYGHKSFIILAPGVNADETFDLVDDACSKTRRISVKIGFNGRVWSYAQIIFMFGFVGFVG